MLSNAEEIQLAGIAKDLEDNWHSISLTDIQFLVDKLRETNDELKIIKEPQGGLAFSSAYYRFQKDRGYKYVVTCRYNNAVRYPRKPGEIAIETVHKDELSRDIEIEACKTRNDITWKVTEL